MTVHGPSIGPTSTRLHVLLNWVAHSGASMNVGLDERGTGARSGRRAGRRSRRPCTVHRRVRVCSGTGAPVVRWRPSVLRLRPPGETTRRSSKLHVMERA